MSDKRGNLFYKYFSDEFFRLIFITDCSKNHLQKYIAQNVSKKLRAKKNAHKKMLKKLSKKGFGIKIALKKS